jgi:hypothetical protein
VETVVAPVGQLEPILPEPVQRRPTARVVRIGAVRLSLAGPYCPRARLFRLPDGRLVWHVRLWEYDRVVPHIVGTETVRTFARVNGLPRLLDEIDRLVRTAVEESRASP